MSESKKRQILIGVIVASILPTLLLLKFPGSVTLTSISLWLAQVLGYAGIVLMLWMYVLGAKSVMGLVFKDLASVLKIHKWLGRWGTLAILLHPFLVVLSYGESIFYTIFPHVNSVFERHVTLGRIAFLLLIITLILSWVLKKQIPYRVWKYLHYLAYICIPFALLHVPDVGTQYMTSTATRWYLYVLAAVFVAFVLVRLRGLINMDKQPYEVVRQIEISKVDRLLQLKPITSYTITPNIGQYVYLKTGFVSEDHPFSVFRYSPETKQILIAYRIYGSFTQDLEKLASGDRVYLGGPYGDFMSDFDGDNRPVVYISGGIGITPFVEQIAKYAGKREQWLFASNRLPETSVLVTDVEQYLGNNLISIYNGLESVSEPNEEVGILSVEILSKYLGDPRGYTYYICGPSPMIKADRNLLIKELQIPEDQVKSEKFGW